MTRDGISFLPELKVLANNHQVKDVQLFSNKKTAVTALHNCCLTTVTTYNPPCKDAKTGLLLVASKELTFPYSTNASTSFQARI